MGKTAIYCGFFDPYHIGHHHVYQQAKEVFGDVTVVIANNLAKKRHYPIAQTAVQIEQATGNVVIWDGLIGDFCKEYGATYLVRGLRSHADFAYEEGVAKINEAIYPDIKTVYFRAKNDGVSSTLIRLLESHGKDVSMYLPNIER